jgi:hypothetical protein
VEYFHAGYAMTSAEDLIARIATLRGTCREDLWLQIIERAQATVFLELGVFRGAFAEQMLRNCPSIANYYMIDPWRHLDDWNKPANVDQSEFDEIYAEAMERTAFAHERRIVLRGKTTEAIEHIPDATLDIAYIDADHSLRGIAIDLMRTYPKVRPGGILGGDDYTPTIWQHADHFEPSLVCPFAAYFAESCGAAMIIFPYNQFAIVKPLHGETAFRVIDTTQSYGPRTLLAQVARRV